jgi:hypothetical protein
MPRAEATKCLADVPDRGKQGAGIAHLAAGCGLVGAIWIIAVCRCVIADTVVPWDSKNQFYAFFRFLASTIHSGVTPFWNPYHYGGHPAVADPQSLIFAPIFVLWALVDEAPSLRSFDLIVYAHLLIGGLAIAAIGWRARWPIAACVLAAAVFMFGGAAAGRLQHTGIIITYGLFPLALLLLQLALDRRSIAAAASFAVVASVLALGRNQVALLLSIVLVAAAAAQVVTADHPLRYLRTRGAALGTMVAITFALVAVPLLLTMQFAILSNRPEIPLDLALKGSLYPADLAQLMVADIFGSHGKYWGPGAGAIPEIAYTDDSFNYVFVGSVPIILLLWLGFAGGGAFRRGRRLLTGVLIGALIYALGRYTPVFSWLFEWVPGVDMFRRPVDANFVFGAALALLVGHLLADYVATGLPRCHLSAKIGVTGCALAIVTSGILFLGRSDQIGMGLLEVARTAPIVIGVIVIMLMGARIPGVRAVVAGALALIAVAELLWWNAAFRLNADSRSHYAVLEHPQAADLEIFNLLDRVIGDDQRRGLRPRIEVVGLGGPWQNLPMIRGYEAINGYNPLRIGFYDRLVSPGEANWRADMRDFPASFDSYDCPLAHQLGLEFVVLGRPIEQVPHLLHRPIADVLKAGPSVWIYRLRNPAPPLKFTRRVQIADADATSSSGQLLASPSPDRALIDDDTPPSHRYDLSASVSAGRASIVEWRPDQVDVETDSNLGGMLVLHGIWYPGWIADIDGVHTPVLRADVLFRGVEIPPGHHHVVFRFEPFGFDNLRAALKLILHREALN